MVTKAYDLKELAEILKAKGMPVAEEKLELAAVIVYQSVKQWVKDSAALSDSKLDDLISPFLDQLDGIVLPAIEKIDIDKDGK